jgi:hypothetical protein
VWAHLQRGRGSSPPTFADSFSFHNPRASIERLPFEERWQPLDGLHDSLTALGIEPKVDQAGELRRRAIPDISESSVQRQK